MGPAQAPRRPHFRACAAALAALLAPAAPAPAAPPPEDKPNIIFIMVDDLGKDWIGAYGADGIETPQIDALAAGGMLFHNAYSMPQCTPTRVTLLTGQYPWRTGWVNHWDVPRWGVGYFDPERYTTVAEVMKSAGYATAIAGKWQINDFRREPRALEQHGFDDYCVWTGYETGVKASAKRYWDAYIHTREGSRTHAGLFGPDVYADFLIGFMKKHRDRPMFLYFPMALTHGPATSTPLEKDVKGARQCHPAMVRYTDHLVGRLVRAVDDLGLRKRTIIVFTTDNGTSGGLRGTVRGARPSGGKASNYEGGVCVPFIVNAPGWVAAGAETDALTDFSDLLPTFAELGGAEAPAGVEIDGRSFAPLLLGAADDSPREWILAMGHGAGRLDARGVRARDAYTDRVVRDKRFKVWVGTDRRPAAFYDLENDPLERDNLLRRDAGSLPPAATAALARLRAVVEGFPEEDARPAYRPREGRPWDRVFDPDAAAAEAKGKKERRRNRPQRRR